MQNARSAEKKKIGEEEETAATPAQFQQTAASSTNAANPLAQTRTTLQQRRPNYSHNNERTGRYRSPPTDRSISASPHRFAPSLLVRQLLQLVRALSLLWGYGVPLRLPHWIAIALVLLL